MRKYCRVRQRDLTDCGAACLASVFAHYGLHVPVARIRQWADTDQSGTSVYGLLQAAKKVNMEAKAVKATSCSLPSVSFPAIAHVIVQESITHFVVIDSMRASEVTVMDPAEGHFRKMSLQAFSEVWTGVLLILVPGEGFQTNRKSSNRKKYRHSFARTEHRCSSPCFARLALASSAFPAPCTSGRWLTACWKRRKRQCLPFFPWQ